MSRAVFNTGGKFVNKVVLCQRCETHKKLAIDKYCWRCSLAVKMGQKRETAENTFQMSRKNGQEGLQRGVGTIFGASEDLEGVEALPTPQIADFVQTELWDAERVDKWPAVK